jgi:hypothetical protein
MIVPTELLPRWGAQRYVVELAVEIGSCGKCGAGQGLEILSCARREICSCARRLSTSRNLTHPAKRLAVASTKETIDRIRVL